MPSKHPFVDVETGTLDRSRILAEAVPLARLVLFFGLLALVPFALAFFFGGSIIGPILAAVGQFVLAVGAGIVLIYVVVRGIDLAGIPRRGSDRENRGPERSDGHHLDGDEQETERAERERRDADSDADGPER